MSGSSSSSHFHNSFSFWWKRFRAIPTCKWFLYWISFISYYQHCSNFKSIDKKIHLFWSRDGIQELIGFCGSLLPARFFRDICNFQTNLDGCLTDISDELKNLCMHPSNLRCLQLYADSPHMHCSAKHSISCIIATCN